MSIDHFLEGGGMGDVATNGQWHIHAVFVAVAFGEKGEDGIYKCYVTSKDLTQADVEKFFGWLAKQS